MADFKALCAELLDKYDLEWRARERIKAALAAEPEPPADGEVADPVIPDEYRGFNAIAYRNGFHAGHKHALTCAALAPQPVPEGPSDDDLWVVGDEDFRANCWATDAIKYARAVLDRWGQQ